MSISRTFQVSAVRVFNKFPNVYYPIPLVQEGYSTLGAEICIFK